jgi:hypothetical protein
VHGLAKKYRQQKQFSQEQIQTDLQKEIAICQKEGRKVKFFGRYAPSTTPVAGGSHLHFPVSSHMYQTRTKVKQAHASHKHLPLEYEYMPT